MDREHNFQHQHLETFMGILRQRYPGSRPILVEHTLEQVVIQLGQFMITITRKGIVEISAATNSHQQVEHLAAEIERLVSQARLHTQDRANP